MRLCNKNRDYEAFEEIMVMGHVYQGRYKSFPIETDEYFYQVQGMSSVMHYGRTLSPRPISGGGRAFGVENMEPRKIADCLAVGLCRDPDVGASWSTNRKQKPK